MEENIKLAVQEYQCSGCVCGSNISCFEPNGLGGVGCGRHVAGTSAPFIGKFFLGMPKGFNRLGIYNDIKPLIFESFDKFDWGGYDKFNVPFWKYLNEDGHTFVRGFMPRRTEPFIHVFLEDCRDKIDCLEITQEDVDNMD